MAKPTDWREVAPRLVHGWTLVAVGEVVKVKAWRARRGGQWTSEPRAGGIAEVGRFERPCCSCTRKVQVVLSLGAIERSKGPPGEFGRRRCPWCVTAWRAGMSLRAAAAKARRAERDRARYRAKLAAKAAGMVQ